MQKCKYFINLKRVFLIFSMLPQLLFSQYSWNFENDPDSGSVNCLDESWNQLPAERWECTKNGAISGDFSLHHSFDNKEAGCDYILINHDPVQSSDSVTFSFRIKHGYPPSSANNWQVVLFGEISASNELSDGSFRIMEGWVLGVNFSGNDDLLTLWRCTEGSAKVMCTTSFNYQEKVGTGGAPLFQLIWIPQGEIHIYYAPDSEIEEPELIGSCSLAGLPVGRQLALRYEYSSERDRNLWWDDIVLEGSFIMDTISPVVTSMEVLSGTSVGIAFSEVVKTPNCSSFQLEGVHLKAMIPDTIHPSENGWVLIFPQSIPNREELQLRVTAICDRDGNCLADTSLIILRNEAEWGDVVINELMPDPDPAVLLDVEEYLELYNRSGFELDLEDWRIVVNSRSHMITDGMMEPEERIPQSDYGVLKGITLPNEGATVSIYSKENRLIHAIKYTEPYKGPAWKSEGGWSLESPDPDLLCSVSQLWDFSSDPRGGTPGEMNSNDAELLDLDPPLILFMGHPEIELLSIHFSEPVRISSTDRKQISLLPSGFHPDSMALGDPLADYLVLRFPPETLDQQEYRIRIPEISDCYQNYSGGKELKGGRLAEPHRGSLLINEIMYDPEEGAPEFIELYVYGNEYYDLRTLSLDVSEGDMLKNPIPLSTCSRMVAPGEYLVVTTSIPHLMSGYHLELKGWWVEVKEMPALPNSGGTIWLTDRNGGVVDRVYYGDDMHAEIVDQTKGVSLERIAHKRSGMERSNWHSAASIEGFATPGQKNSQHLPESESEMLVGVKPVVFSPDNDGYEDLLEISVSPGRPGWLLHIWITDLTGNKVRILANNHLAGTAITYTWDGERDDGTMISGGLYSVHVRGYDPVTGERWRRTRAVGVIYR